ncbi:hypothetical protein BKA82DRAFT_4105195 [Pisolithus tinctorius]|nr:hypothetical protein BKA82DRAFT_4105195 [Pisolithus tinctorius]
MHVDLLPRQCVSCPAQPPACTCSAQQSCILISQSCNACPTFTCRASASTSASGSSDSGISAGVLAGAIVAVLLTLVGALLVFFLYRRRQRARRTGNAAVQSKPDMPAPAAAVLNRPDPIEKSPCKPEADRPQSPVASVIDVSPQSVHASGNFENHPAPERHPSANPFDDVQSIQTVTTHTNGTNVIPIALAPSVSTSGAPRSESGILAPSSPVRPARPSDLSLDGSQSPESLREPSPRYAQSQRSGSSHVSCMSGASYSSELLNEAPMIVTQGQGAVRQVLGKVKAEVIQTSGPSTPTSLDSLKPPSAASRPSIRSPLAATSFGPADVVEEAEEDNEANRSDPFDDHHRPISRGPLEISNKSRPASGISLEAPNLPWAKRDTSSRPDSVSTQSGSIVDISSATRVNVGLAGRLDQKSPYRTTMGKLVSSGSVPTTGQSASLDQQQQMALAHAQAQARAHGLEKARRVSGTSVVSTTSTRADSILESFPFVPPSPIASRPVRSPPRSPLYQQASSATPQSEVPPPVPASSLTTSQPSSAVEEHESTLLPLTPPPSRRMLGMSTASELSTASSGLGNFPFQIDHGGTEGSMPSSNLQGRQRASLDTLALMSDLSSYPLGYDRDEHESLPPLPKP